MRFTVESLICEWNDSIVHEFVRLCNMIVLQPDLKSLESVLNNSPYKVLYEEHFCWIFDSHYFRLYQKNPYTNEVLPFSVLSIGYETENSNISVCPRS